MINFSANIIPVYLNNITQHSVPYFINMKIMPVGSKVIFIRNLPSTNTYALSLLASEKPEEGTIVRTDFQSAGRGQPGNKWDSEPGKNLLFSIILYPERILPINQFMISMAISLGMHDYLAGKFEGCKIKWPNDIYINDDKIAGILIESAIMGNTIAHMVAGIGLNVNQETFRSDIPNPVSMKILGGTGYDLDECLAELSELIGSRYDEVKSTRTYGRIRQEYTSKLYRLNTKNAFRDLAGHFTGTIKGVDKSGVISIEDEKGRNRRYSFREVEFIH